MNTDEHRFEANKITKMIIGLAIILLALAARLPAKESATPTVDRLLGAFDTEPLLALCVSDVRTLPQQLNRTNLLKILQSPSCAQNIQTISMLLTESLGADFRALWPDISQFLAGPAVLALLPPIESAADAHADFRLTLSVLTPTAEKEKKLRELWPQAPPQTNSLLSILKLQTVLPDALPSLEKMPAWARADHWPKGALILRALPRKFLEQAKRLEKTFTDNEDEDRYKEASSWVNIVTETTGPDTDLLLLGLTPSGEMFTEDLFLDIAPEKDTTFARVVNVVREQVGTWDGIQQALPGDQDVVALGQVDLKALKDDLPCAAQALERYLRGRRWARNKGRRPEVFEPTRFSFLFDRLQGSFGIVGTPSISGNIHITVAAAMKNDELDIARNDLIKGFKEVGADFGVLEKARRIGGSAPLGARFQGRGLFNAPVIGLSHGWAWLCSNSSTYQNLTTAFKTGKTLKASVGRDQIKMKESAEEWRAGDALRLQINLERMIKLAYAVWVLSAEEGPFLGAWKVPMELLPQPAIFNDRVGTLRMSLSRQGNRLKVYAHGVVPGMSLFLVSLLQSTVAQIQQSRQLSQEAQNIEAPEALVQKTSPPTDRKPTNGSER
ncbi:MAG: hypothetical protein V1899_05750 [Planctomycetota bacterium]